jgi:hypothetical protein
MITLTSPNGDYVLTYRDPKSNTFKQITLEIGENGTFREQGRRTWCNTPEELMKRYFNEVDFVPIPNVKKALLAIVENKEKLPPQAILPKLTRFMAEVLAKSPTYVQPEELLEMIQGAKIRMPTREAIIDEGVRISSPAFLLRLTAADRAHLGDARVHDICMGHVRSLLAPDATCFESHQKLNAALKLAAELLALTELTQQEKEELRLAIPQALTRRPYIKLVGDEAFALDKEFKRIGQEIWNQLDLGEFIVEFLPPE